jgi:hypothetical protein
MTGVSKMDKIKKIQESGQSIVLVALVFFGLVTMLALVLDGGNLYTQRRVAQVAADAGALAGARHLCGDEPNYVLATDDAYAYAVEQNQATDATITFPSASVVRVETTVEFDPFFAQVLGYTNLTAAASAAAGCDSPGAGNILPITWTCPPPPADEGGEPPEGEEVEWEGCYFDFAECDPLDEGCTAEPPLYVFMDNDFRECITPPNSLGDPDYQYGDVDCDWDDDGTNDAFVGSSSRGFLNLNEGETSSDIDLRNKVFDACVNKIGVYIEDHTWVPGQTGVGPPVYDAVQDYCLNQLVIIPVYDYPCGKQTNDPVNECVLHDYDDYLIGQGAENYYHIAGFAAFRITCVHAGPQDADKKNPLVFDDGHEEVGSLCPGRNELQYANPLEFGPSSPMTMEGYLLQAVSPDISGIGGIDSGTYVTYLIE